MDKWKVCDQTMNQSEKILEIKDLCVEFKTVEGTVKAINHLNYTLHKGEKLGIVGESGSGKSVSSLGIMQLIPNPPGEIVGGEILYKGQDLVKKSEKDMQKIRGNEISMIFQEPMTSLNPIIKCGRQIAESLRLHRGMNKKEAMEEAIRMMQAVGIANPEVRAYEYPHQMSGGMRQRVMIAMALASPHWIQDMFTRNIHRLLLMHVMRIFSSSTAMTVQQNLVWQILMNSQMTIRL